MWKKISIEDDIPWHADHGKLTQFGDHLVDHGYSAKELQGYYEKPWHWRGEQGSWERQGNPEASDCDCPRVGLPVASEFGNPYRDRE